jgi:hypothetical protein
VCVCVFVCACVCGLLTFYLPFTYFFFNFHSAQCIFRVH